MKRLTTLTVLLIVALVIPMQAQDQPAVADNNQDEQINISADATGGKFTILRSGNKAETQRYISQVVELKSGVNPYEILPHVLRAVNLEKGSARTMKYTPPDGGPVRTFLQVVTTPEQMPSVVATIEALDLPGAKSSTGVARYSIRVRHRLASELAQLLKGTLLSGEGKVYADDLINTLFIEDSVSDGESDYKLYEFYDVPIPQVKFDVQVIETVETDLDKIGLDWQAWKHSLGGQFDITGNWFEGGEVFSRMDALLTLDAVAFADFLNYLAQHDKARVHQRVTLIGNNLSAARLSSAVSIPTVDHVRSDGSYATRYEPNNKADTTGEGPRHIDGDRPVDITPDQRWEQMSAGDVQDQLEIEIQPVIGMDSVNAHIYVRAINQTHSDELDSPLLCEKTFESVVSLINGKTLHLATIDREVMIATRRGIPGLRDIPVLKYFFSFQGKRSVDSKIYITVTPNLGSVGVFQKHLQSDDGDVMKIVDPEMPEYIRRDVKPAE